MQLLTRQTRQVRPPGKKRRYIPVIVKFTLSHLYAAVWTGFSIQLSIPWLYDLSLVVSFPVALLVIAGIAYIPGYINVFMIVSLLLDRQPRLKSDHPSHSVTILIAARNEEAAIEDTLQYIRRQDYDGKIKIIVIDNGSADRTGDTARLAGKALALDMTVLYEDRPGKYNALNKGLDCTETELVITLDADTLLHRAAVRYLIARLERAPDDVAAVAGSVLVRNSRANLLTRMQEWDYFLGIASIKRLQGLYQGTLVAQGAFSLYRTADLRAAGGWPDAIGEDIILTWNLLRNGGKVYYEPLSVAFTEVPASLQAFSRQRSRWARGMIEALARIKPWQQPLAYTKYLTGVNLLMPYLDVCYVVFWIPGLLLALIGIYWIVGVMTLLVLPLTLLCYGILYLHQRHVFRVLKLRIRKNTAGFILFVLFYQIIMSPVSVWGYLQEFFKVKRTWK
jgi:biofilm PGA synthesis N-glycosyltransferase PgaC